MIDGLPRENGVGPQENIRQRIRLADYVVDRRLVVILFGNHFGKTGSDDDGQVRLKAGVAGPGG